jgi:formylglycine-generating enzyme required for sulfatase activity
MSSPEEVPYVNWGANGYRLPTEAEWEKAARGGFSGLRFPWLVLTNINTISESQANYYACMTCQTYDLGPYNGDNTNFDTGAVPYTSQVGDFAANGYGLYDMAGNIQEWCWDWHGTPPYQAGSPYLGGSDPYGPATGTQRITRGGDWDSGPSVARCANRDYFGPTTAIDEIGFRCVRGF